jgi:hypothetical protein
VEASALMAYNSAQILLAVLHLRPSLKVHVDFELADLNDGKGPFISIWNRVDIAAPTQAEIEAVDTEALSKLHATFFARDLLAQLTPIDYDNVLQAVGSSPALGLLWASLLAQGEAPISVSSDRFKQGWAGLARAIGVARAHAIAIAVGIPG